MSVQETRVNLLPRVCAQAHIQILISAQLEGYIQVATSLPADSDERRVLSRSLIRPLWNDLRHPPLSYLGNKYRYRQADGSYNNIMHPQLGAAGSAYARTVAPTTLASSNLPDPSVLFDTIFARGDTARTHPTQISSVLFYLAAILTHGRLRDPFVKEVELIMADIFRTDDSDPSKMKNSSYLDLSPLYGSSDDPECDACTAKIRTFKDGLLFPDTFSESRAYGLPPGVAVLLICFNRLHNFVASQLKQINEGGRFDPSPHLTQERAERQVDEELYQTARLITCALYVNIILHDYLRTILHLHTSKSSWSLDPRDDADFIFQNEPIPAGVGNQVSVEFNLVYRWHSAISERDARWVGALHTESKDSSQRLAGLKGPVDKVSAHFRRMQEREPKDRVIYGLHRNNNGRYMDSDLVNILTESTQDVAGALGARNVPRIMKYVEMRGIEQARRWQVCTLNEFRKSFKLEPHKTFADISSNKEVAEALKTLYSEPDLVELYPGLIAEDNKESFEPAHGLCCGFTTSRTILSDAVALIRGDRFYTVVCNLCPSLWRKSVS